MLKNILYPSAIITGTSFSAYFFIDMNKQEFLKNQTNLIFQKSLLTILFYTEKISKEFLMNSEKIKGILNLKLYQQKRNLTCFGIYQKPENLMKILKKMGNTIAKNIQKK